MPGLRVAVDGEEGFLVRLDPGALVLRKGPKRVSMPFGEMASIRSGRRPRYGRTMFWIGVALLPALGFGTILLAIYHFTRQDAIIIGFRKRNFALSGDEKTLGIIRDAIGHERPDMKMSEEE